MDRLIKLLRAGAPAGGDLQICQAPVAGLSREASAVERWRHWPGSTLIGCQSGAANPLAAYPPLYWFMAFSGTRPRLFQPAA